MIYLDNASTTKMIPSSKEAMHTIIEKYWGNPSSLHRLGVEAEKVVKQARTILAGSLEVDPDQIFFTSGATESCNLFIRGIVKSYDNRGKHLITSETEHPAVLETMEALSMEGYELTILKTGSDGRISLEELEKSLRKDTILVALMHVNNETGVVQPITQAGELIKKKSRAFFFVDGVQGYLKIPLSLKESEIDGYAVSAHKVHGPKGTGALYIRKKLNISSIITGGGQERGLRSGTENTPGVAGFARAVQSITAFKMESKPLPEKRMEFINYLQKEIPELRINGADNQNNSPYIINLSLPDVQGETLLHGLEADQIFVSTGSACSGKEKAYSKVLLAMKVPESYLKGSIRISMGLEQWPDTMQQQAVAKSLKNIFTRMT